MKKLRTVVLGAGVTGLVLAAGAGATTRSAAKVRHVAGRVEALAIDGDRIAYDVGSTLGKDENKVLVWNVRTGETTRVSGNKTRDVDDSSTGSGVFELAIAGSRVAWMANVGGNSEGDDYLFTSSVAKPKEKRLASVMRTGDSCPGRGEGRCAGEWLGGLVGSGSLIALNRWTTDADGAVTAGQLDVLNGTKLNQVATGASTVQAATADGGRVAVLHADESVALYSAAGELLLTVNTPDAEAVALRGKSLLVATKTRQLELYNTRTGSLRKALPARGARQPRNLDVQGDIAIYTTGSAGVLHAVNLSSGKDRVIAKPHGGVFLAHIDSAGLAYAGNGSGTNYGKGTLVFVPFARVKTAVS